MNRDTIILGASMGGLHALEVVLAGLPDALPASVFVVQHTSEDSPRLLPQILQRSCPLPIRFAETAMADEQGRIYVAPPGAHLVLTHDSMLLTWGPRENGFRPAIDTTFRSAAIERGTRVIAAVLTGMRDDGARGAAAVHLCGGRVVVQDPRDAVAAEMPMNALNHLEPDVVCPTSELADALVRFTQETAPARPPVPPDLLLEARMHAAGSAARELQEGGEQAPLVCPECNGLLSHRNGAAGEHFVCHTGHSFSLASLISSQEHEVERAMYAALRALQEQVRLLEKLSGRDAQSGRHGSAQRFEARAGEVREQVELLKRVLFNFGSFQAQTAALAPDAPSEELRA